MKNCGIRQSQVMRVLPPGALPYIGVEPCSAFDKGRKVLGKLGRLARVLPLDEFGLAADIEFVFAQVGLAALDKVFTVPR